MSKKLCFNRNNAERSARYELLADLTWKKKPTVKVYFNRKKMDIMSKDDFDFYLKKYKKDLT